MTFLVLVFVLRMGVGVVFFHLLCAYYLEYSNIDFKTLMHNTVIEKMHKIDHLLMKESKNINAKNFI